jgi:multidrug efflux pump subunit AcrA (membrane-fusion protein)
MKEMEEYDEAERQALAGDAAWEALQKNQEAQEADFQLELNNSIRRPQGFLKRVFMTIGKLVLRK